MADVWRHESSHAYFFWVQGGTVHAVDGNSTLGPCKRYEGEPKYQGRVFGSFPQDQAPICHEKDLATWFAGGVGDGIAEGTGGDMQHVVESLAWASVKYPEIQADAIKLMSAGDIPEPELEAFFSRHAPRFQELISPIARKAIDALADALRAAEGGKLTGQEAVKILEKAYAEAGEPLPPEALPAALHGGRPDQNDTVDVALRRSRNMLELARDHLESLRPESAEEIIRSEKARDEIVRAIFNISFL